MKAILRGMTMVSVLALGAAGAQAADLIEAPVVVAPEVFNWTGFYVGVHGGLAAGKNDYSVSGYQDHNVLGFSTFGGSDDENANGGFGGVQVGYNYQFGSSFVAGVEADIAAASISSDSSSVFGIESWGGSTRPLDLGVDSKVDWFGTLRARLGFAVDNVLFYGTGGAAYGHVKTSYNIDYNNGEDTLSGSNSETQWGWTVGAGFEYGITKNVTLKAEYLYVDLGSANLANDVTVHDTGFRYINLDNADVDTKFHTLKAGLNYKF